MTHYQDGFKTTLTSSISSTDISIPLGQLPTNSPGFLIINPSSANMEVIKYTSTSGGAVLLGSTTNRGRGTTTAKDHPAGSVVVMGPTSENFSLENLADGDTFVEDLYNVEGKNFVGWATLKTGALEYNSANALQTTTALDLTPFLQIGDKIRWGHTVTTGMRYGVISAINYNSTVPNKTYIVISGSAVLNEALVSNSLAFSRYERPYSFPYSTLSIYPVGSIYTSVVDTTPSTYFVGTWVFFASVRTLVVVDT
jgi:hypothetical protein